jgi:hypothetical protein
MNHPMMQVARSIQADRLWEAEHHRRVQQALAGRQRQSKIPAQALVHLAQMLTESVQHSARASRLEVVEAEALKS